MRDRAIRRAAKWLVPVYRNSLESVAVEFEQLLAWIEQETETLQAGLLAEFDNIINTSPPSRVMWNLDQIKE